MAHQWVTSCHVLDKSADSRANHLLVEMPKAFNLARARSMALRTKADFLAAEGMGRSVLSVDGNGLSVLLFSLASFRS